MLLKAHDKLNFLLANAHKFVNGELAVLEVLKQEIEELKEEKEDRHLNVYVKELFKKFSAFVDKEHYIALAYAALANKIEPVGMLLIRNVREIGASEQLVGLIKQLHKDGREDLMCSILEECHKNIGQYDYAKYYIDKALKETGWSLAKEQTTPARNFVPIHDMEKSVLQAEKRQEQKEVTTESLSPRKGGGSLRRTQ